jgi:RNA polymerase sigma factor (sigma-70 family)
MTLRREQRAAIVLRYFEDLSEAETAEILRIPVGTVKSTVSRGIERLRAELERET